MNFDMPSFEGLNGSIWVWGTCICGCGETTKIATKTVTARGQTKGQPHRYIRGHHLRKSARPSPTKTTQWCADCLQEKLFQEYTTNANSPTGRYSVCNTCLREKSRQYREQKPDKERAAQAAYNASNRDMKNAQAGKRRARERLTTNESFSYSEVYSTYGYRCHLCGDSIDPALKAPEPYSRSVDHIIPISRGGSHTLSNVRPAHLRCNIRKGSQVV